MNNLFNIPISILDLSLVRAGHDFAQAFKDSVSYIQFAEKMGINRFWVAEHHNAKGIASSATAVVIGHLAEKTNTIRVGAGGIMLPNHSPLQVAEAFGTLETMYPNRIDLGIGRAPGTDQKTAAALRRNLNQRIEDYPQSIQELQMFLGETSAYPKVNAYPGKNTHVPIWVLGSSTFSAQVAALLGLPYAFASHFAPTHLFQAASIYRDNFQPSSQLKEPYFMPAANVVCSETEEEAIFQSSSFGQMAANIVQAKSSYLQPPLANVEDDWHPQVKSAVHQMRKYSFVGTADQVRSGLKEFIKQTQADEIMLTSYFYEPENREKSFKLLLNP